MKKLGLLCLMVILTIALVGCSKEATEIIDVSSEHSWSYDDSTGPDKWGELAPGNATCVKGNEQSPINLEFTQVKEDQQLEGHDIDYEPTTFTLLNNGYTIQADATTESNSIIVEGIEYRLAQFHFHTPSEHQFNGQNYAMELHLVHKNKNDELAVIGVMIKEGKENDILSYVWDVLPKEKNIKVSMQTYSLDLQALLPENQTSFHYEGSLTTPPCTEDVKWIVLEEPIEMSKEQVQAFQQIFPDNHRPVQPLNEREIIKR